MTRATRSLLVACLLAAILTSFNAQLQNPLLGAEGGNPPWAPALPGGPPSYTDVAVSALLERVTAFSTSENTYHAAWWVILTWKDAGAGEAVRARSAQVMNNASDVCARSCDSNGLPSAGCCDALWLPHIEMPNLIGYDEDQLPRYRINANASSGAVSWSTRIIGRWYSPLDFRAYPFDHQHLLMEMAIADSQSHAVGLKWEHVAKLNNTAHTKGADLSGWRVKWGKGKLYDSRTCQASYGVTAHRYYDASNASSGELAVLVQSLRVTDRHYADNSGRGTTAPDWCGTYAPHLYDEARALYGPIVLVADIMVKRVSSYYVMANLIPVLIISLVVFVVYCMPCNALGDRMVVIMTLFLSLTAMQFVFDFPPANYLNALQQVVLVAYVMMLVACVESLVINRIATLPVVLTNKRTCFQKYSTLLRRQTNASAGGSGTLTRRVSRALTSAFTKFRDSKELQRAGSDAVLAPYSPGAVAVAANLGGASVGASATARRAMGAAGTGIVVAPGGGMVVRRTVSRQRSAARRAAVAAAFAAAANAGTGTGTGTHTGTHTSAAPTPKGVGSSAPSRTGTLSRLAAASGGGATTAAEAANTATASASSSRPDSGHVRRSRAPASPLLPPPPLVVADAAVAYPAVAVAMGSRPPSVTAPAPLPTPSHAAAAAALQPAAASPKADPNANPAGLGSMVGPAGSCSRNGGDMLDPVAYGGTASVHLAPLTSSYFAPVAAVAPMPAAYAESADGGGGGGGCFNKTSSASIGPNAIAGGGPWRLRRHGGCFDRLFGCLAAAWAAVAAACGRAAAAPDRFYQNCKEDAEFAWFVASRIDKYCCVVAVCLYVVIISVLLWVQTQVGDHKMMLGDRPGNM